MSQKSRNISQGVARTVVLVSFFVVVAIAVMIGLVARLRGDPLARKLTDGVFQFVNPELKELERAKIAREATQVRLETAKIQSKIDAIPLWRRVQVTGVSAVFCAASLGVLVVSVAYGRRLNVYWIKLRGAEFPVLYKDIRAALPAVYNMTIAERIEADAPKEALTLWREMGKSAIVALRTQSAHRAAVVSAQYPALSSQVDAPNVITQTAIPTFADALRDMQTGSVLIGYNHGEPTHFKLDEFVSCAFGGGSGSGKTTKLRFLCGQLAAQGVNLSILDAHAGDKDSLVTSLGAIATLSNVRIFQPFEAAQAVKTMLQEVQHDIDTKRSGNPHIYVLDELRPLNRACEDVELLMDKLANEGRKFDDFGIFSSQTWEAKMFKTSGSAARDACVLKMAANMPKQQARILFQDGDTAKRVAKLQQPEMFADSMRFSGVVTVPFCSRHDMDMLAAQFSQQTAAIDLSEVKKNQSIELHSEELLAPPDGANAIKRALQSGKTQADVARAAGVSPALISKIKTGQRRLTNQKLAQALA